MIKKGLKVRVLTGKDKKKEGEVIEIDRANNRAKVKEINMVKKHVKTTKEKKGGIFSKESFIHLSNLKLIDEKGKTIITEFKNKILAMDEFKKDTLEPIINELIKSHETNFKGVGQPLRVALTGSKYGPGLYDIIISLGKEEVQKRLNSQIII